MWFCCFVCYAFFSIPPLLAVLGVTPPLRTEKTPQDVCKPPGAVVGENVRPSRHPADGSAGGVFPQRPLRHGRLLRVVIGWSLDETIICFLLYVRTNVLDGSNRRVIPQRTNRYRSLLQVVIGWFQDETVV